MTIQTVAQAIGGERVGQTVPLEAMVRHTTYRATTPQIEDELLLIIRLGDRPFAIPTAAIVRVLPMAAPTPLPDSAADIVGVLTFQGMTLPVVDPRPRLGLPVVPPHPDQHLVAITAGTGYLLWIDRAETIVAARLQPRADSQGDTPMVAPQLVRVDDEHIPVLSPAALDPGAIVQPAAPGSR